MHLSTGLNTPVLHMGDVKVSGLGCSFQNCWHVCFYTSVRDLVFGTMKRTLGQCRNAPAKEHCRTASQTHVASCLRNHRDSEMCIQTCCSFYMQLALADAHHCHRRKKDDVTVATLTCKAWSLKGGEVNWTHSTCYACLGIGV